MTNAVKHFKWTAKGKRRIHAKPNWGEIAACRPWLDAELAAVRPDVLVALGATAGQSLFGRDFRVTKQRGQPSRRSSRRTPSPRSHPSAILRSDGSDRDAELAAFVDDLRVAAKLLAATS